MNTYRKLAAAALGAAILAGSTVGASADWAQHHPRRVQVNHRLGNQNFRTNRDLRNGSLTAQQAQQLHSEDHSIRQEERFDASLDGGHITKAEQHSLNQQENTVSKQIYNESH